MDIKVNRILLAIMIVYTLGLSMLFIGSSVSTNQFEYEVEIKIYASQWQFDFIHQNGSIYNSTLPVYANVTYLLNMTSVDVKHGVNIYGQNITPSVGSWQAVLFASSVEETVNLKCIIACGTGHGGMAGKIIVSKNPGLQQVTTTVTVTENSVETTIVSGLTVTSSQTLTVTKTEKQTINQTVTQNSTITETLIQRETIFSSTTLIESLPFNLYFVMISFTILSVYNKRNLV